jgi:hypothetical protein
MNGTVKRLVASFQEILASSDLSPEGTTGDAGGATSDLAAAAQLFADLNGMPCPQSMQPGLVLPTEVAVRWQASEGIGGEVRIASLLLAFHATLDASLEDTTLAGHRLADMRIADSVLAKAGPLYTLFEVKDDRISEQLFLYDQKELLPLELTYDRYLEMAAASRGLVFWQTLFCDQRMLPGEGERLSAGLSFLEKRFPAPELSELSQRLRQRSD